MWKHEHSGHVSSAMGEQQRSQNVLEHSFEMELLCKYRNSLFFFDGVIIHSVDGTKAKRAWKCLLIIADNCTNCSPSAIETSPNVFRSDRKTYSIFRTISCTLFRVWLLMRLILRRDLYIKIYTALERMPSLTTATQERNWMKCLLLVLDFGKRNFPKKCDLQSGAICTFFSSSWHVFLTDATYIPEKRVVRKIR